MSVLGIRNPKIEKELGESGHLKSDVTRKEKLIEECGTLSSVVKTTKSQIVL